MTIAYLGNFKLVKLLNFTKAFACVYFPETSKKFSSKSYENQCGPVASSGLFSCLTFVFGGPYVYMYMYKKRVRFALGHWLTFIQQKLYVLES